MEASSIERVIHAMTWILEVSRQGIDTDKSGATVDGDVHEREADNL